MKSKHAPLQAVLLLACALSAMPAAAEYREQDAHVHGVARMDLVLDGHTLAIDLDMPAANLLGFEHAPRNKHETAVLEQTVTRLRDARAVFSLPQTARCKAEQVVLESPLLDHQAGKTHEHADMEASYRFHCASPAELDGITVNLFQLFPATEKLEVQLITPKGQGADELTADSPRLTF